MQPLIYTNLTAAILFIVACLIWNAPEVIGTFWQTARVSRRDAAVRDRGSMGILIGLQWIGLALNFALGALEPGAAIPWQRPTLFLLGVGTILLGIAVRWYAIGTLREYFTRDVAVSAHQRVVCHGPYRYVRHPAYSGTLLTMAGVGLAMTNWLSMSALLLCVIPGHLYPVSVEEQALVQTIGQPYREYMRHTRRFIPWVL